MEFDPTAYDKSNNDTLLPAKQLIKVINDNSNNNKFPIILDIGCGTGNMTKLLWESIDCDLIIGCDIDPNMIKFAQLYNYIPNAEYVVQDISTDWQNFNENLQNFEGKVSVITSNFSLTWVKDITTAAQNIFNLLSNDGMIALNIVYDGDIYKRLTKEERIVAEKLLKYPSEEELIGKWITALRSVGLNQIDVKYWEPKVIVNENIYTEEYINIPINWYKSYSNIKNGADYKLNELIKRLLIEDRCKRLDIKSNDGQKLIEVTNYIWQIVAKKI